MGLLTFKKQTTYDESPFSSQKKKNFYLRVRFGVTGTAHIYH